MSGRTGQVHAVKTDTTPAQYEQGVLASIDKGGLAYDEIAAFVHGTTLFTNALIERKGAKTGLLTTAGFRDVLEIGRERKYELYDLLHRMPKPLSCRAVAARGRRADGGGRRGGDPARRSMPRGESPAW